MSPHRVVATALLLLACCAPPEFTQPLTPARDAKPVPALLGSWVEAKPSSTKKPVMTLEIAQVSGAVMSFLLPGRGGEEAMRFEGHVSVLGQTRILNLQGVAGELAGPSYLFVRYELAADGTLQLWVMRDPAFRQAVKSGALAGRTSGGSPSSVIVTDSPENVRRFVAQQKPDELWEPLATFTKR